MTTPTILDRLAVVTLLAKPNPMGLVIAGNPHLTKGQVEQIAADAGYPKITDLRLTLAHLKVETDREKSLPVRTEPPEKGHRLRDDAHPAVHEPAPRNQHLVSSTPPPPARPQPVGQPMRPYDATAQLLLEAAESGSARTSKLATRIEADLIRLRDALALERQKKREAELAKAQKAREAEQRKRERERLAEKARQDAEQLKADIAAAEAKLRELRAKARTKGVRVGRAARLSPQHPDSRRPGGLAVARSGQLAAVRGTHDYQNQVASDCGCTIADIRTWANEQGLNPGRGSRIARDILDAYQAAHPTQAAS